jgi:chemotaxis protein MotA
VSTIYGVGLANLVLLPAAGKMKIREAEEQMVKAMMLEGVISILEGMNPRMIETRLRTFLFDGTTPLKSKRRSRRRARLEEDTEYGTEVPA